jgi:hypothetical protein
MTTHRVTMEAAELAEVQVLAVSRVDAATMNSKYYKLYYRMWMIF